MWIISILEEYWESLLAFGLFGLFHSICAHEWFKEVLTRWTTSFFVEYYWRFTYCLLSYIALYHGISALHWVQHPTYDVWIYEYPEWLWRILLLLHLFSIGVIYVAFLQSDYLEFWGVKQMWRGVLVLMNNAQHSPNIKLFGTARLETKGIYAWVRHPMLVGGLLFLLTSGPSLNNIVFLNMYGIYMVLGAYFEEKRLVRIFGDQYRQYQKWVGAFIPKIKFY